MGLKGQSHRGANGRDSGRQTEKKGDETRQRRQWECMFHSRNKRLYELTTIFEERARARKSERRRFTRGPVISRFFPILQNEIEKIPPLFHFRTIHDRFVPFRTVSYCCAQCCTNVTPCNSFDLSYLFQIWYIPLTFGSINLDYF